jgi:DNA-binding LacI/PurR family transcriptional regulator
MSGEDNSQKVTIFDVAKMCGVSYQTVSRVINGSPAVSAKTRRLILDAIGTLGYHPNQFARGLKTRRSCLLEVITFGVETYVPRELMFALGRAALTYGYSLMFTDIKSDNIDEENRVLAHLKSGLCDAAIMTAPVENTLFERIIANPPPVPIIQIRNKRGSSMPSVMIDQLVGSQLATRHLIDLGHRQIAEISGPLNYHEALTRHMTFLDTLKASGLSPVESVEAIEWMPQEGYQAAKQILDRGTAFTALVVSNDYLALGAILALKERGFRVPEDVSIIGYDDSPEAAYFTPPLTTIRQDYDALAQQSIQYLVELIYNPNTPAHQRVLMPQLIVRKSTIQR